MLLVARDEAMEESWDEIGFELASRLEGPFIIGYESAHWTRLDIQVLEDPYWHPCFAFSPYQVGMVGSGFTMVSIVTPSLGSDFSVELMATFVKSLELPDN